LGREDYLARLREELDELDLKLTEIRRRIDREGPRDKIADSGELAVFERRSEELRRRMKDLERAEDSLWENVKIDLLADWDDLKGAFERWAARLV